MIVASGARPTAESPCRCRVVLQIMDGANCFWNAASLSVRRAMLASLFIQCLHELGYQADQLFRIALFAGGFAEFSPVPFSDRHVLPPHPLHSHILEKRRFPVPARLMPIARVGWTPDQRSTCVGRDLECSHCHTVNFDLRKHPLVICPGAEAFSYAEFTIFTCLIQRSRYVLFLPNASRN